MLENQRIERQQLLDNQRQAEQEEQLLGDAAPLDGVILQEMRALRPMRVVCNEGHAKVLKAT